MNEGRRYIFAGPVESSSREGWFCKRARKEQAGKGMLRGTGDGNEEWTKKGKGEDGRWWCFM